MWRSPSACRLFTSALASLSLSGGLTIQAEVTSGNSHGFGLQLNASAGTGADLQLPLLGATGLLNSTVDTGRLPATAFGTAAPAYDTGLQSTLKLFANGNLASVAGLTLGPLGPLDTTASATADLAGVSGTFNGRANSDVNGALGPKVAHGFGSVEGLQLDLVDLSLSVASSPLVGPLSLNPPPLLSFSQARESTLSSDSTVSGDANAFTPVGASVIANLDLSVNGGAAISLSSLLTDAGVSYSLDGGGNIIVAPNTILTLGVAASGIWPGLENGLLPGLSLDDSTLLELTLNKQVLDGNPLLSPRITTTALEISLSNLGLQVGLEGVASLDVTGGLDLALGQSQAQLIGEPANVPEAGTWAASLGCFALAATGWWRSRRVPRT